jgi:hypothetical protein
MGLSVKFAMREGKEILNGENLEVLYVSFPFFNLKLFFSFTYISDQISLNT